MIEPKWELFRGKFSENPQDKFEWLCYLLFCKEYKQEKGIFRFKNQSGMETNPVKVENDYISWESKFYTTEEKLSDNVAELKKKIDIVKSKNPETTKLCFYTPIDWTESSKKTQSKTKKQKDVEKYAQNKNIELVWKGASFFESPFVSIDNAVIAKHFFTEDKSIFDLIDEQKLHTENILTEIRTSISFDKQTIEINREDELERIKNSDQRVLVLSGVGGVGKTALIKKLYEDVKGISSFYLFKATEFELRGVSDFFQNYDFQDFVDAHKEDEGKTIVIDSAERLLDLKNTAPFKEFLSILIKNDWRIIFTTRDNYLEDLRYQFFEIYNIAPLNISLQNLEQKDLALLSEKHSFQLPRDEKLLVLIRNPFHLKEYLKYYQADETLDYEKFRERLWNKNIKKSKPARSECFLKTALERANHGCFFVVPDCESSILDDELVKDGILGYEDGGYFITHDIYEEWALEKIIDRKFSQKKGNLSFFKAIGQSLPIRRSFRNWVSEKLLLESNEIKDFIEEVINDPQIDQPWKNETLISILLSEYSDYFFDNFKDLLLTNKQELLRTTTFWLRIACKEVDKDFFKQIGIKQVDLSTLKYILTKPKGNGWKSVIKFVFDNLDTIGIENIHFILPIIYDWNSKFKIGETTRFSSLIALQYYQWIMEKGIHLSRDDDVKNKMLHTILYGSSEIKGELKQIIEEILRGKWKNHQDPYYDLSKVILTKLEGISLSNILPKHISQLADLFWTYTPKTDEWYSRSRIGVEQHFEIEDDHLEYFPSSAYQTPTYWLLQFSLRETIDFILTFTNKTTESFAKSDFAKYEVEEIEVSVGNNKTIKQYISTRLWCTYRGTQLAPHVLESMHMALEKFFLERGKNAKSETLEYWLLYLLKNSKSASISAIVTSLVLAFPDKTFNVAKILFQTKEFFLYETQRLVLDQGHKNQLLMLKNNFSINSKKDIHENERLKACDDKHRKWHLETLFLNYQVFRNEEVSEQQTENRQKALWKILDNYYKDLPEESKQTETDKTWRIFLARMDYRKMKPTTKKVDGGIEIHWNPKIDSKLKKRGEEALKKSSDSMQYTALKMWAYYKMKNDKRCKQYKQYEKVPKLALKEVKEIISKLQSIKKPKHLQLEHTRDEGFYLLNHSIPAEVCSVLIKDYFDKLSHEEAAFCKDIVLEVASSSLKPNYQYQISDGVQSTISILPVLLNKFARETKNIQTILLLTLFDEYPIGIAGARFNNYSIIAIQSLWKRNFKEAQSLLFGYLLLKPKYEALRHKLRRENSQKGIYEIRTPQIVERFLEENEVNLRKVVNNNLAPTDIINIEKLELSSLKTIFQLIPLKTDNKDHQKIVKKIITAFAEKLISEKREDRIDYMAKHNFLEKLAYFVLSANKEEVEEYLKPLMDKFENLEVFPDLFKELISAEDSLNTYDNFWKVWGLFTEKVIGICQDGDSHRYTAEIIRSYLFATVPWKETTTEWHTFKQKDKKFFKNISKKIGHCSSTLYAISKLLDDIGSPYLDDGIIWLSKMLKDNESLHTGKLEINTIYYIENNIRKYIYKNREKIRKTKKKKEDILVILDFLITKGSVVGYILRETIL